MGSTASKPANTLNVNTLDEKRALAELSFSRANHTSPTMPECNHPTSEDGSLTLTNIATWEDGASSDPKQKLARLILQHTDIKAALQTRKASISDVHVFNHSLEFKTHPITNQKSSGRCWLFATTNVLRYEIMKQLNLKEFQLSQSYLFFYDKLNKANYYLELSMETSDLPLDDRLLEHLSSDLISDGGQVDMAINLLENYGVVPQSVFPESLHSSLSGPLNTLLKTKLREHALILRSLAASLSATLDCQVARATLRAKKEELMKEVWVIMTATLGVPPSPEHAFVFDFYDTAGKAGKWTGTPVEFYKAFLGKYPIAESFSLINDPRNAYSKLYTVDKLGNVWGGRPVLYVNTEIDNLKNAVVKMIKTGVPVFFGCDVGKFSDSSKGIMDTALFDYEAAFSIELGMNKKQRIMTGESAMTHAMVISGVHLDENNKPIRYKVENSWGDAGGDKGYFVMTDKWFEEFVFQIVVHKSLAPKELVKVFEGDKRAVLPAWDPMGSLA